MAGFNLQDYENTKVPFTVAYLRMVGDMINNDCHKQPITWGDITLTTRTPNPEGRMDWELGWLHYTASKTGREYYLPLTRHARAAVDRLRKHAIDSIGSDELPSDRPILPCPTGHGLTNAWKLLQATARVAKPTSQPYQLEDFRKTCATYLSEHHAELPYHVCGWSLEGSRVAHRHYINSQRTLVEHLPTAPRPGCFDDWLQS
jgi:integrase